MRIKEIQHKIQEIIPKIVFEFVGVGRSSPQVYDMKRVDSLNEVIRVLDEIGILKEQLNKLKKLSFYNSKVEVLRISNEERGAIQREFSQIIELLKTFDILLKDIYGEKKENVIQVKVPLLDTFLDLKETSDKLEKIFSQTLLHKDIGCSYEIIGFDRGSNWIDVLVNNKEGIVLIAGLMYSAAVTFKKLMEGISILKKMKEVNVSEASSKEVEEKLQEEFNQVIEIEANYIYQNFYKSDDPEQIERIKLALKEATEIYKRGGEIKAPIAAPKNITDLFPDIKRIEKLESKVKKLEKVSKNKSTKK